MVPEIRRVVHTNFCGKEGRENWTVNAGQSVSQLS